MSLETINLETIKANLAAQEANQAVQAETSTETNTEKAPQKGPSPIKAAFLATKRGECICTATVEKFTSTKTDLNYRAMMVVDGVPMEFVGSDKNARGMGIAYMGMSMKPWVYQRGITLKGSETKADLVEICKERSMSTAGTKTQIAKRLTEKVLYYQDKRADSYKPTTKLGKAVLDLMLNKTGVELNEKGYPEIRLNLSKTRRGTQALFFSCGDSRVHRHSIAMWQKSDGSFSTESGNSFNNAPVVKGW